MKKILATITALTISLFNSATLSQDDESENKCKYAHVGDGSSESCLSKADLLGSLDLAAPTNPLFTLIGSTPESVITPKTGDELMLSWLPTAVDAFGNESYALALEVNPGLLILPEFVSIGALGFDENIKTGKAYKEFERNNQKITSNFPSSYLGTARRLSRFSASVLAVRKSGDVETSQYGIGLSFNHDTKNPLVNNAEYRACVSEGISADGDIANQYGDVASAWIDAVYSAGIDPPHAKLRDDLAALKKIGVKSDEDIEGDLLDVLKKHEIVLPPAVLEKFLKASTRIARATHAATEPFFKVTKDCVERVTKWNRNVYGFGMAAYTSQTDNVNDMTNNNDGDVTGYGAWVSLAWKMGKNGQIVAHARYNEDMVRSRQEGEEEVVEHVDAWSLGSRYTHLLSDQESKLGGIRGFVEVAYAEEEFGSTKDEFWQAGIGAEFSVGNGLYLQAVIGDTFSSEIDRSSYLSGQLKWSFTKGPAE